MPKNIAVIGAGFAGIAAAQALAKQKYSVTLLEASRHMGGRARSLQLQFVNEGVHFDWQLDNGQHILIGAYQDTLALIQHMGVDLEQALLRLPMQICYPHGKGLQFPKGSVGRLLPDALNAAWAIITNADWSIGARLELLKLCYKWHRQRFHCLPNLTVNQLCTELSPMVFEQFIEPLCISALNTPSYQADAQTFLRVLQAALFTSARHINSIKNPYKSSDFLIPKVSLNALLAKPAAQWFKMNQVKVQLGARVLGLQPHSYESSLEKEHRMGWYVNTWFEGISHSQFFDEIVIATSPVHATKILQKCVDTPSVWEQGTVAQNQTKELKNIEKQSVKSAITNWLALTRELRYEAITTVYAYAPNATLNRAMLALASDSHNLAQFVFDKGQLQPADQMHTANDQRGLLAFVISASSASNEEITKKVLKQAQEQLNLELCSVQTIVEKRATLSCTPHLKRPPNTIAPHLWAVGDYTHPHYPSTLEGAVQSALNCVQQITANDQKIP